MKIEGPATKQKVDYLKEQVWKTLMLPGIGLSILSVAYYFFFTDLEQEGGTRRVNALALAVYELMGIVPGTILFGVIGALLLTLGIYRLVKISAFAKQIPAE